MTTIAQTPQEITDYLFDWSRSTGKMRFTWGDNQWLCDRFGGQWEFLGTERSGKMHVRCYMQPEVEATGEVMGRCYVSDDMKVPTYEPDDSMMCNFEPAHDHSQCQVATNTPFPQGRNTHWRLCYAREIAKNRPNDAFWRLRDERTGELWFVHDYRGVVNVNYLDHGSHIFVDMPCTVDENGIAHFGAS